MTDYDDYENNLAFDPTANSGLHQSYTDRTQSTIELIEKIEKLTKELDVKEAMIKNYTAEIETQRQQLAIAVKALDSLRGICFPQVAEKAFEQIKELDK